jgi:aminopeptidase-like protein
MTEETREIEAYFDRLWPICRSIMGPGYRASLQILSEIFPHEGLEFRTGERVHDWTVPEEWEAFEAYVVDPNGRRFADFERSNLHLLNYSVPFDGELSFDELKDHLYTIAAQPDAIPYVTSYYAKRWGICISHDEFLRLPRSGRYAVKIRSEHRPGRLVVAEAVLPGDSDREVLFSSYLCHPSLANNELSGPLILSFLFRRLQQKSRRKLTYRFVLVPETIGAVAFLSRRGSHLKQHCIAGYQLSCIGDAGALSYKTSRQVASMADRAALAVLRQEPDLRRHSFNPAIGSDERQYCSPGYDLPIGSVMRTMYTLYPEYHTSLDNKSLMDFERMGATLDRLVEICEALEENNVWKSRFPYGEPQLGPRGLFRSLSEKWREDEELAMWWILNYADGRHDALAISELSGVAPRTISAVAAKLADHGLLDAI